MCCTRRILGISWKDHITNNEVLQRANMPSMVTLLRQPRLRWLGHVTRMKDGRIPKDLLYAELAEGKRASGRPHVRFKDVCKRDLKAIGIEVENWVKLAHDRNNWRSSLHTCTNAAEVQLRLNAVAKRAAKKIGNMA